MTTTFNDLAMYEAGADLPYQTISAFGGTNYLIAPFTYEGFEFSDPISFASPDQAFAQGFSHTGIFDGPWTLFDSANGISSPANPVSLFKVDGGDFSAISIQLDTNNTVSPDTIVATGYLPNGTTVTATFITDRSAGMQTFYFGSAFQDVTKVVLTPSSFANFQFDNFTVNQSPILSPDASGPHALAEGAASTEVSTAELSFTDADLTDTHSVSVIGAPTLTWSTGGSAPQATVDALANALTLSLVQDSTGGVAGSVLAAFSAPDSVFGFLSAGETLTATYNVTVTDSYGGSSTQPVTFTFTSKSFLWYGGSGDLGVASNWSQPDPQNPVIPGGADHVFFNAGSGTLSGSGTYYDVSFWGGDFSLMGNISAASAGISGVGGPASVTIENGGSLTSSGGFSLASPAGQTAALTVDGVGSSFNAGDNWLHVADQGTATLTVENSASMTAWGVWIGTNAGGNGSVAVDNATVSVSGEADVGVSGAGVLTISGGGRFTADHSFVGAYAGATGAVTVDGAGSTLDFGAGFLAVGNAGTGTLTVENGASLNVGLLGFASYAGSQGDGMVSGAGSTVTDSGLLDIGAGGSGSLTISAGATVAAANVSIGDDGGVTGSLTVDGAGSALWVGPGETDVGVNGAGVLDITNGGSVSTDGLDVGVQSGGTGQVTVDGAGSALTFAGNAIIGDGGAGMLTISDSAAASNASGGLAIGNQIGSDGTVTVDNAVLRLSLDNGEGWLNVGNNGSGSLTVQDGGSVQAYGLNVASGQNSTGAVTVSSGGTLAIAGPSWLIVGDQAGSTGSVTVNSGGTMTISNSSLFAGQEAGSTGVITVDGAGSSMTGSQWGATIGGSGDGTLTVSDSGLFSTESLAVDQGTASVLTGGAITTTYFSIGAQPGETGAVTVDGAGSSLTATAQTNIGDGGTGTLTVSDSGRFSTSFLGVDEGGASVSSGGAITTGVLWVAAPGGVTTTITIDGAGSSLTAMNRSDIGVGGSATLSIEDAATMTAAGMLLGDNAGAAGAVTVTGVGSTLTDNGALGVGEGGAGALTISDSAVVSTTSGGLMIGDQAGSNGTVTVDNAALHVSGSDGGDGWLTVGNNGAGTLTVQDGGSVQAAHLNVASGQASSQTSKGVVTVETGGTLTVSGSSYLIVGNQAGSTGQITVESGGGITISSNTGMYLGKESGSTGVVTVDGVGSSMTGAGGTTIGDAGTGTLTVSDSGLFSTGSLAVGQGTVSVSTGGAITVTNLAIDSLTAATGDVSVDGAGSSLTVTSGSNIGGAGAGNLSLSDSGRFSTSFLGVDQGTVSVSTGGAITAGVLWLASFAGMTTTITVDGAGSSLTATSRSDIGVGGSATLTIEAAATMTATGMMLADSAGASGAVTVDGVGSTLTDNGTISVGQNGAGTLTISDSALVSATSGGLNIGDQAGSNGTVTVDSATLQVLAGNGPGDGGLTVGNNGSGSLTVENGGSVQAAHLNVASGPFSSQTSTGVVTVSSGGTLNVFGSSFLTVGNLAGSTGEITVDSGGKVTISNSTGLYLGQQAGSTGSITVDGVGSSMTGAGGATIGDGGAGTLTVSDSGLFSTGSLAVGQGTASIETGGAITATSLSIGAQPGATGDVTIDGAGSSMTVTSQTNVGDGGTGTLTVSDSGRFNNSSAWLFVGQGTVSVSSGGAITAYNLDVHPLSGVTATITLDGAGSSLTTTNFTNLGDTNSASGGTASVTVENGAALTMAGSGGIAGSGQGSTDGVTVTGAGSSLIANGMTLGGLGSGALTIQAGGSANLGNVTLGGQHSGSGQISVGAGAVLTVNNINVGQSGSGLLSVNGGAATITGNLGVGGVFGGGLAGPANVVVAGAGASVTAMGPVDIVGVSSAGALSVVSGALFAGNIVIVGFAAQGQAAVSGGSALTANSLRVGGTATGEGTLTIDGAGTSLTAAQNALIANGGTGTLSVQNGGVANLAAASVAVVAGSHGALTVDGVGSSLLASSLTLGAGAGAVTVQNHGSAVVNGAATVGSTDSVLVTGPGSSLTVSGALSGLGAVTVAAGGTLEIGGADSTTIQFAGIASVLKLDTAAQASGLIAGFARTDVIDLVHTTLQGGVTWDGTHLGLLTTGAQAITLDLGGLGVATGFRMISDGAGGTEILLASPSLTVNGGLATPIGAAGAHSVAFAISGLLPADTGVVTFTDAALHTATVNVTGGQASYSADLSLLNDGPISNSLQVVGQSSAAGATVTLDQDLSEHPTVSFANALIGIAGAPAEHFTVSGLQSDDSGAVTFSDGVHNVVVQVANGAPISATVNLSSLSTGPITASLAITDTAGNSFSANAQATLDLIVPTPIVANILKDTGDSLTTISGVSEALSTVKVYDGSTLLGSATADATGAWNLKASLAAAMHSLTETAVDPAGNTGASTGVALYDPKGNVTLAGGSGADVLFASPNDTLTGGAGVDTFVFDPGFGNVKVTDFNPTLEELAFSHTLFTSAAQVLAVATDTKQGAMITVDSKDVIALTGVTVAQLSAHTTDFHFF
jgi:T5SS/PEP-CTERM-associated repeat protein